MLPQTVIFAHDTVYIYLCNKNFEFGGDRMCPLPSYMPSRLYNYMATLPSFSSIMIDKQLLTDTVERAIEGTDLFLVDINVSPDNSITVEVESAEGVDIDQCVALSHAIEAVFDRDVEDYELEVGSAGITSPFKVIRQYEINIGNPVEILTADGRKLHGTLAGVEPDGQFTVEIPKRIRVEGQKKPVDTVEPLTLTPQQCKYVKYDIDFK